MKNKFSLYLFVFFAFFSFCRANAVDLTDQAVTSTMSMSDVLCNAYTACTGPAGKLIAVLSVVALGVGCFLGKLSFQVVAMTAAGIACIFGAVAIVNIISGGSLRCTSAEVVKI